jgi:hypothetical protein
VRSPAGVVGAGGGGGPAGSGQLPPAFGGKTFGGRGRNQVCDCCGQIIAPDEIEYQIEFTPTRGESGKTFVAHIQCHWLWWEESDSQGSPSESPGELSLARNAMRGSKSCGEHIPNSPNSRDDTREDWYPSSLVLT